MVLQGLEIGRGRDKPIKSMLVKRWVHFRWAVVLSCSFYTCLFKTIWYICDFFSLSISVFFVLCIGLGMFVLLK